MTNLTHSSFLYIYFNSLHVSNNPVLIIRRINFINTNSGICHSVSVTVSCVGRKDLHTKWSPTQSDIYQRLYWYNWNFWWWARVCSKHVQNWNKYIEKYCASSWSFTKKVQTHESTVQDILELLQLAMFVSFLHPHILLKWLQTSTVPETHPTSFSLLPLKSLVKALNESESRTTYA